MKKNINNLINKITRKVKSHGLKQLANNQLLKIKYKDLSNEIKKLYSSKIRPSLLIEYLQDRLELLVRGNDSQVVLKQSKFWIKSITWLIMGGTAFSVCWISLAKTDEIVISTGKLEPKGGVIDVQMPLEGIAREILIKEGEEVNKGQVLIRLDTEITEARNISLKNNLELNTSIKNKLELLLNEGAVSELQYLQQKEKIEDIKREIKVNNVKLKYQEIVAPVTGIIFELQPKSPGYVAKSSEPVLQIVPTKNLIATVEIDSRTIGFVSTGKKVEISIDSFPATDFGVIEGVVTSIGSDALTPVPSQGKGYRFPAKISLNNQYLELKNGKKLPLQAGMSLTANIKLRKVTYLQLLFSKFGDKAQSLKAI